MKASKKICLFALITSVLTLISTVVAFAEDKGLNGGELTFGERLSYALQGTVTGMVMVFAVLALLWAVVAVSKIIFYDLPKRKANKATENKNVAPETPKAADVAPQPALAVSEAEDGELIAVITAAVAAMIESGEYKNEFAGGFRVVSFKRSSSGAWNRK